MRAAKENDIQTAEVRRLLWGFCDDVISEGRRGVTKQLMGLRLHYITRPQRQAIKMVNMEYGAGL